MNDKHTYFKLVSTYEVFITLQKTLRPLRIEVFASTLDECFFRSRIWIQNTRDMPLTFIIDGQKDIFSSDEVNIEITSILAENVDFMRGKEYENENDFMNYIYERIESYEEQLWNE